MIALNPFDPVIDSPLTEWSLANVSIWVALVGLFLIFRLLRRSR